MLVSLRAEKPSGFHAQSTSTFNCLGDLNFLIYAKNISLNGEEKKEEEDRQCNSWMSKVLGIENGKEFPCFPRILNKYSLDY